MTAIACLRAEELQAYLLGETMEPRISAVKEHLGACRSCEARAARLEQSIDPALRSLRRLFRAVPTDVGSAAAETVRRKSSTDGLLIRRIPGGDPGGFQL